MDYQFSNRIGSLKPSAIREILKFTSIPGMISFAAGNPAPEAFPVDEINRISSDILKNEPISALQYSITEGYGPLRETMSEYMKNKYNTGKDFDDLIITSGAQQVMQLSSQALCNEGDTVICENPSFIGSLNAFRSYGLKLRGVSVEPDGMNMNELENALKTEKNAKFIYTIPNFQNPTGVTMSLEKRKQLYALALKYNVLIVEDNPYGEIRFAGENIPTVKSLDTEGIVIYAGSFSKVLSPGMRVGYAIAPKAIISKMTVCKQIADVHTNIWSQVVADKFMKECDFEAHLERIRAIYRNKYALMSSLIDKYLLPEISYNPIEGGLFIWCELPEYIDIMGLCSDAVKKNVAVVPGVAFQTDESEISHSIRLNFSTPTDEQIKEGMERFNDVFRSKLK